MHCRLLQQTGRQIFVALVAFLIAADAIISTLWLLPVLFCGVSLWLQQFAGAWIAVNIISNFLVCVLCSPGCPRQYIDIRVPGQIVTSGQYENFTWCKQCNFAKPPQAHHCRRCGRCVMDMDHHCFFLNNCVGRNNLKCFLLFLIWLLLGAMYIMGTALYLLYQRWDEVHSHTGVPTFGYELMLWSMRLYANMVLAPGWLQTATFLLSTATGALLGVSGLLKSQLSLVLAGKTYIGSLQHNSGAASQQPRSLCVGLQQTLVQNVSWSWLWPCWHAEGPVNGSKRM
ncbi:hypothetical protein ABBQ38_009360 [Trebouxia sp. C0009 RCD-2024]